MMVNLDMQQQQPNYARKCRACLECVDKQEYADLEAPLFDSDDDEDETDDDNVRSKKNVAPNLLDVFNDCTRLQVRLQHDDDDEEIDEQQLPAALECEMFRYLCGGCIAELRIAYQFIAKARQSHEKLLKQQPPPPSPKGQTKQALKIEADELETESSVIEMLDEEYEQKDNAQQRVQQALAEIFGPDSGEEMFNSYDQETLESTQQETLEDELQFLRNYEYEQQQQLALKVETENAKVPTAAVVADNIECDNIEKDAIDDDDIDDNDDEDATSITVCLVDSEPDEAHEAEERQHMLEFKCELCTEKFDFQRDLISHYAMDHDEKDLHFGCDSCAQRFYTKRTLNVHIRQMHQNCEYADCLQCGRAILQSFMKIHVSRRHSKSHKFLCNECPRTFSSKYTLKKHLEIHSTTRQRDFICATCARTFYTIESFRTHQITHQDPQQRDTYSCSLCQKTFMRQTNLKLHMQMHRGETMDCPHCGKKFVRRKDLEIHIRFHTGEFPYVCATCGKRFAIKGHLNAHEKKHRGIKYKCNECSKEFINVNGLRQHKFEHTGMPLCCGVCQKGFPTKFKVRRHIRSVHSNLFGQGYKEADAEQYVQKRELNEQPIVINAAAVVETLEEEDDDDDEMLDLEMLEEEDEEDLSKYIIEEI